MHRSSAATSTHFIARMICLLTYVQVIGPAAAAAPTAAKAHSAVPLATPPTVAAAPNAGKGAVTLAVPLPTPKATVPVTNNPGVNVLVTSDAASAAILQQARRVKGFADLHAHPGAHLAFGASSSGSGKLIAGSPGMALLSSNPSADLRACAAEHFWDDADIVRSMTRSQIRDAMDGGTPHGRSGAPEFRDWPHARSVLHQQMHISWVYRAYQGGMRLMVASLSDNQTLAMLWNRQQFATNPNFNPNADFEVAKTQAAFIERWVSANASWMQIVTSAAEARTAILNGKLAIILGTEMDTLTTDQILTLARQHKVRLVLPIHFADNQFGGPAVYGDLFNTNNRFLTGAFYQVMPDNNLAFRLNPPQYLRYVTNTEVEDAGSFFAGLLTLGTIGVGAMKPTVDRSVHYPAGGHRNSRPFNEANMRTLMREGLLLDVAHMSQIAHDGVFRMTGGPDYPVLNSHTGLRAAGTAESERAMRESDARTMSARGGVLGIGTVGDNQTAILVDKSPAPDEPDFLRLTGATKEWLTPRRPVRNTGETYRFLRVTLTVGKDDKRDSEGAWVVLKQRGTARQEFDLVPERRGIGGNQTITRTFPLSTPLTLGQVDRLGLRHETGEYFKDAQWRSHDNWNIRALRIELLPDPVTAWTKDAASMLRVMGNRGIALGTDFNGLEKQMPALPTISVDYPVNIVARFAPNQRLHNGQAAPSLQQHVTLSRPFDFRSDGLAHYGMLPDFLQAVSKVTGGEAVVSELFNGAEAVLQMWEKVEVAKTRVP